MRSSIAGFERKASMTPAPRFRGSLLLHRGGPRGPHPGQPVYGIGTSAVYFGT